ncbi:hypothetical protein [Chishuiella sp.]|uniref:hypothetical protein n=1 Tax=Chishuiella sp. TaxID=1969467 RepID=UPI0028AA12A5|nr:hypothetical protein [Chishuiella sp.]
MCKNFSDIIFCTCSDFSEEMIDQLENYWVLYRYNEKLDIVIVGEIILDPLFKEANSNNIVEIILKKLNTNSLFDKLLNFEKNDRLQVYITLNNNGINFGFEFNENLWKEIDYDFYTWTNKFEAIDGGKIDLK